MGHRLRAKQALLLLGLPACHQVEEPKAEEPTADDVQWCMNNYVYAHEIQPPPQHPTKPWLAGRCLGIQIDRDRRFREMKGRSSRPVDAGDLAK
jgi:hypothetical protein